MLKTVQISSAAASNGVTSVTGTSPVVSSGGTTPDISMPAANTSVSGYLTSTDWNTFNSKGSGSVTSVGTGTGLTGGPITGSGTVSIATTGVSADTYGSASVVPIVTINAQGQITSASNASIAIANSAVSGLGTMSIQNANNVAITGGSINAQVTNLTGNTSVSATMSNASLLLVPAGYLYANVNSTVVKIPYYAI